MLYTLVYISIKDVGGAKGTRCVTDTQTDRMTHRRTRVISIVPPLLRRVTNRKNSYTAFNHICFFYYQNDKVFHDVHLFLHVNKITDLNEKLTTTVWHKCQFEHICSIYSCRNSKKNPDINESLIIWKSRWNYVKTWNWSSCYPTKACIDKITSLICIHIESRLNICMQWQMTGDPFESL